MVRSVLVTGASKGIGRAVALRLAQDGFYILVHYGADRAGGEVTLSEIKALGGDGRILSFDISDRVQCKAILDADIEKHGAYYGVVLNAGIMRDAAFPAMTGADWDGVIHTNLDGFYNVLHPSTMPMVSARNGGRIVVMSSISGVMGNRGQTNYAASKAGLIGAAKSLAVELAKRAITVNIVAPGLIGTQMADDLPIEDIKKAIPMRRLGTSGEVAGTVSFLFSADAGYITRQVISINGGMF